MTRDFGRRLASLEQRFTRQHQRVAIIGPDEPEPAGADFVIRIVPAPLPGGDHA
jgi:hypothetical protein